MDPWSKGWHISEVIMVMERPPGVNPPSDGVETTFPGDPEIGIAAATEQCTKSCNPGCSQGFLKRGINIGQRGARGWTQGSRRPPGAATRAPGPLVVALWPHPGVSGRFLHADFYLIFLEFLEHF